MFPAVYSHPFFPDVHAMVCVLYEDQCPEGGSPGSHCEGKVFPHRIAAAKAALAQAPPAAAANTGAAVFSEPQLRLGG